MTHLMVPVDDGSQVAEARRRAVALAHSLGFDEARAGTVALAVTEVATNLVRHARDGRLLLGSIACGAEGGVEVYALDRGPGIANLAASLRNGASTAGGPGLGLGSLTRLTSGFEVYTQSGKGTVMHFEIWADPRLARTRTCVASAAICVAKAGESMSGDAWLVREARGRVMLFAVDGLGHGPEAAAAAAAARKTAWDRWEQEPAAIIDDVHAALRSTRGAAAAVAVLKPASEVGTYCGVGNVASFTQIDGARHYLVSHNGTVGHQMRKIQEFSFPFPRQALLIMCTDGIATRWCLKDYPGLEGRSPALIAGAVFRDHARGRDDATVAVLRNVSGESWPRAS